MKFPMDRPVKIVMLGAGGTGGYVAPYLFRLLHMLDMFVRRHNRKDLEHKELMEHLKDKDPAYYYTDILVPNGRTLGDFIIGR